MNFNAKVDFATRHRFAKQQAEGEYGLRFLFVYVVVWLVGPLSD